VVVVVVVMVAEAERRLRAGQHGLVRVLQEVLVGKQVVGRVGRGQRVAQRRVVRLRGVVGHLSVHSCEQVGGKTSNETARWWDCPGDGNRIFIVNVTYFTYYVCSNFKI